MHVIRKGKLTESQAMSAVAVTLSGGENHTLNQVFTMKAGASIVNNSFKRAILAP